MTFARFVRIVRQRARSILRQDAMDAEVTRELAFHFDALVEEYVADGVPLADARRAARVALGNVTSIEEQCRDHRRVGWVHDLRQDLHYGLRTLRANPGFTIVAALSLAVGIGANTAVIGVMDEITFHALPFTEPDRLVIIQTAPIANPRLTENASLPDYVAWKDRSRSFETIGASLADQRDFAARDGASGAPIERIGGHQFMPGVFTALGAAPSLGRLFTEEEAESDARAPVMVISHQLWQTRFGGDPGVIGTRIVVSGVNTSIIGVMPPAFRYPNDRALYWVPLRVNRGQLQGSARYYIVTARLGRGVTLEQAQAELDAIAADLAREAPGRHGGWGVRVRPARDVLFGWTWQPLLTLEVAVGLVLLIACVNVAGLLLARGTAREREIVLRAALGAGRGRIVRQLVTESVLLSAIGGLLGVAVAWAGVRWLSTLTPPPGGLGLADVAMGGRVLGVMALVTTATGLLFGVVPAAHATRPRLTATFTHSRPGVGGRHSLRRLQSVLVALQIALALVLSIGAGLLTNSVARLMGRDLHFDPSGIVTSTFMIPGVEFSHQIGSYQNFPYLAIDPAPFPTLQRVREALRAIPGVQSVGGISNLPLASFLIPRLAFTIDGRRPPSDGAGPAAQVATYFFATPDFFSTMRIPIVRGREFDEGDTVSAPWVAVVNETMAKRFWPGEDAIGKRFTIDIVPDERPRQIVGVVKDVPTRREEVEPAPVIYASYLQHPARYRGPWANQLGQMTFVIRTAGEPMRVAPDIRRVMRTIAPHRPVPAVWPLDGLIGQQLRSRRTYVFVLGLFASIATLLAAVGIYGVMAYSVAQRTHEFGIRLTLGADARELVAVVARTALPLIVCGVLAGLAGSMALTDLIASQLWGITPTDPATFAAVSLLLLAAALAACVGPVRRAVRVDPTVTLRCE